MVWKVKVREGERERRVWRGDIGRIEEEGGVRYSRGDERAEKEG